jgi:hypothetical protein
VPIDVTPRHHCQALPPPSSHRIEAFRTHPSLGGEAPAPSVAVATVLIAGAPPEAIVVTVCPSRLHVAGLPLTVFAATSKTVSSPSLGPVDGDDLGFGALDAELEPPLATGNGIFPTTSISHRPA